MAKKYDFTGYQDAIELLDAGIPIKEIAKHPNAAKFFSYHTQCKKMILKDLKDNPQHREYIIETMKKLHGTMPGDYTRNNTPR